MGGAQPAGLALLASLEGGHRLGSSPFWLHGQVTAGRAGDDQGSGPVWLGHAGIEARTCWGYALCASAGLDLGGEHVAWIKRTGSSSQTADALVAIPRAACDIGSGPLRVSLGIEINRTVVGRGRDHQPSGDTEMAVPDVISADLSLGLRYQW